MIISDKQTLRRCLKQLVRRADVVEASLNFDVLNGEMGIPAMLGTWTGSSYEPGEALRRAGNTTPLCADAAAMFAAMDALELPVYDLDRADMIQKTYTREAYLREILDAMRARHVFVRTPIERADTVQFEDDRFSPLLDVGRGLFLPGRYGVDYAEAAQKIIHAAQNCGTKHIMLAEYEEQALRYCLLPACEDAGLTLHVKLETQEEVEAFSRMLDEYPKARVLVSAEENAEKKLIEAAVRRNHLTVCLTSLEHLPLALSRLGTRFVPYSSRADLPEQMLGRWTAAREAIWQALCDAYLPLARSGFDLDSERIAHDVDVLLCGNI